jgi:UDP-N-acetylmuramoyl-L-alanyl-D-glutamate--2,6-diaminopimelate ligase
MRLGELLPEAAAGDADIAIAGLTADSRRVRPGYLFAALKGVAAHGRDFIAEANARGAAAILSGGDLLADPGIAHVIAEEPRQAFAFAAAKFYPRRPQTIVAVTGTNGKSSTVDFLRQIWAHAGRRAASLGTLGAIGPRGVIDLGHTTPDPAALHATLQRLADEGVTHAAMEASSHGLEQYRLDGVALQAAAFTNLTQDHLDYHSDMDAYRAAKLRLWGLLDTRSFAVVNVDSPEAPAFVSDAEQRGHRVVECGWRARDPLGLKIVEIQPRPNGQTLTLRWRHEEDKVALPLIGEFQALNAVCAAALALSLGEEREKVWAGMAQLKPVKGRLEHVGVSKDGAHVFVDYAHTPDGLNVLLRAARPHAPGRVICVFGCGGDRDTGKRPQMGAVAAKFADVAIVTDDNPRSEDPAAIRAQVLAGAPKAQEIGDRREAIRAAIAMLQAGDALLIAGKGHETGQIIRGVVHPFSDQDVAREALGERGGMLDA